MTLSVPTLRVDWTFYMPTRGQQRKNRKLHSIPPFGKGKKGKGVGRGRGHGRGSGRGHGQDRTDMSGRTRLDMLDRPDSIN